jgi:hypothetical protein
MQSSIMDHMVSEILNIDSMPPRPAARVFAEGTRVADKLLIIDLPRIPPWRHVVQFPFMLPLAMMFSVMHDGYISALLRQCASAYARRRCGHWPGTPTRRPPLECRSAFDVGGRWQIAVASR